MGGSFLLVAGGLGALAFLDAGTSYWLAGGSLVMLGAGAGVASTTGSAAILGSAPPERAGGAAAVQEAAFELGGALGVAVLGSVMTSAYQAALSGLPGLPAAAERAVREGLPSATEVAGAVGGSAGASLLDLAKAAFVDGLGVTVLVAAAVMAAGAVAAFLLMPGRAPTPRSAVA